jgi:basic amino acid/polyamine antiporter, APA family
MANTQDASKYFVRNATGLVREFSATDTLLIASAMVFALVFTTNQFAWFYGNTSGANLPLSLIVAAIPFAFLMLAYYVVQLVIPRTGSDYVWVSRIFSPSIGFAWALLYMFVVFFVAYVGEISAYSGAVGTIFTTTGILGSSKSIASLGNFFGGSYGAFELAILFTILFGLFALFGTRFVKGVIYGSWIAAIIGMVVMWYILGTTSTATFQSHWNAMLVNNAISGLNSSSTYSALYNTAVALKAPLYSGGASTAIAALPLASLFLFGGNYISGFGGEIKNVKKSIPIALFLSLIFGIIFWTVTSQLTINTVGANWMTAVGWNWDNNAANPSAYALPFAPNQPLMLAVAAYPNTALIYLMFVMYIVGSLAPLFAYFWIPTKYFFSWSFDRAVPTRFSNMSQRFNTPYWSVFAVVLLGIVLSYIYEFAGWSTSFTVGSVVWGLAYVIPGLALMVFPFAKKNLFEQAPGFVKAKVGGFPIISLVGLITAVGFAYIAYIGYGNPAVTNVTYAAFGFELLAAVVVIGFVVYYASKFYYKSRGIDISLAYKDIPPE